MLSGKVARHVAVSFLFHSSEVPQRVQGYIEASAQLHGAASLFVHSD
jgi:hypothetical protein